MEIIGKGKVAKPWEFGVKVSVAVTNRESFVVGCRSILIPPYDGHTLAETLEQAETLSGVSAKRCYVDRGYKGVEIPGIQILRSGQKRGVKTKTLKRELKRRSAINAVMVAAGHNLRLLLRAMAALLRQRLGRFPAMTGPGIDQSDARTAVPAAA